MRADGRFQLTLQASITTDDGERIALAEDGILVPPADESGMATLRLNMKFTTGSEKYRWLNLCHVWGRGTVNWNNGEARVQAYIA